jgi:hypothetical protein
MGMAWLAALGVLLGLFPGAALELAAPAIRQIAGAEMGPPTGAMALSSVVMQPGLYTALLIAVLLGALTLGAWAFARGPERTKARSVPPWNDGFAAPPPWLPFGDPATQLGPDSFARLVAYALPAWPGLPLLARIGPWLAQALAVTDRAARRRGQTALLATLALLLAAIAWRGS